MCWNKYVSLNTFVFSVGMLLLMIYNNAYSPYKVNINVYGYFFILSFCFMQLIEYFLWKNIENRESTYTFSLLGQLLVAVQPVASLLLLTNPTLKAVMISIYLAFIFAISLTHKKVFKTTVVKNRLNWSWVPIKTYVWYVWGFFLLFSFLVNKYYVAIAAAVFLNIITRYSSVKGTGGSLWCWSINISMIVYAMYLLLYCPFLELKSGKFC